MSTTDLAMRFMQGSNDAVEVRGSFQETAPRKTAENTVKHCDGDVDSVVANHRGGGESSVVVTTLHMSEFLSLLRQRSSLLLDLSTETM